MADESLPNYNFTGHERARRDDQTMAEVRHDPEKIYRENYYDLLPPKWALPMNDVYLQEMCGLLRQEELHRIRAYMDDAERGPFISTSAAMVYMDQLISKYSSFKLKLFLKELKDMLYLYADAYALPPI